MILSMFATADGVESAPTSDGTLFVEFGNSMCTILVVHIEIPMEYASWCIVVYILCRADLEGGVSGVPCNCGHIRVIVEMFTHTAFRAAADELKEAGVVEGDASLAGADRVY